MIGFQLIKAKDLDPWEFPKVLENVKEDPWNTKDPIMALTGPGIMIYRVMGDDVRGIIVCEVFERKDGNTLFVKHLIGKGMLKVSDEIMGVMRLLARELDCATLTCIVGRPGLVKHYIEKLGFKAESTNLSVEV